MGTTDDLTTSFLIFSQFSTALWDLANSRPVHSQMLSSHLFFCLPCLLPPFTVPCKMILARPNERKTCPYHCSLRLFAMVWRSSGGLIAFWILARTSSLVTWSLCEMHSILQSHLISMACILLWSSSVRVRDSELWQPYHGLDTRKYSTRWTGQPSKPECVCPIGRGIEDSDMCSSHSPPRYRCTAPMKQEKC